MAAIRAILGAEAKSVSGEIPEEEEIRERCEIQWSGGIKGIYENNRTRGNYWEITGTRGALRGLELHLYEGDRKLKIITETVGDGSEKKITRAYVPTEPEIVWESHLQAYALPDADKVAVTDAWCSLYDGIVNGKSLDYPGEGGRKDMELLIAIRESAFTGERVALPLTKITEHEKLIHSEFEKVYGVNMLDLNLQHLKKKYTLPGRLRDVMYTGRSLKD
jgi:predicted dehydrogenase